jgi:hypothetical protein
LGLARCGAKPCYKRNQQQGAKYAQELPPSEQIHLLGAVLKLDIKDQLFLSITFPCQYLAGGATSHKSAISGRQRDRICLISWRTANRA